ncbi:MAG: hypothetical protein KAY32_06775 [Candidatus Eisenbacteria sp.]|nr:hypothetical protein [Candidatus Eisenbacteria bacterium]
MISAWLTEERLGRTLLAAGQLPWRALAVGMILAVAVGAGMSPAPAAAQATSAESPPVHPTGEAALAPPGDETLGDSRVSGAQEADAVSDPAALVEPEILAEEVADQAEEDARFAWLQPVSGWFTPARFPTAVATLLFGITLLVLITRARGGRDLYIRRIAGLEAVDEAVGRATEMGRPILYSPGLDPMEEVATVASINILGQVARKAAAYETRLIMPNRDPIVMTVSQEVVREAFTEAGRPDLYDPNDIYYTTQSQFGYAAAVCGTMMRERPAANFFIGHFYAESLILAETGNATGAIQIAGTDSDSQLPFFICACDYTLIGEELYAGSVYLSREPLLLGALKGQDVAKVGILAILILWTILSFLGIDIRSWLG